MVVHQLGLVVLEASGDDVAHAKVEGYVGWVQDEPGDIEKVCLDVLFIFLTRHDQVEQGVSGPFIHVFHNILQDRGVVEQELER